MVRFCWTYNVWEDDIVFFFDSLHVRIGCSSFGKIIIIPNSVSILHSYRMSFSIPSTKFTKSNFHFLCVYIHSADDFHLARRSDAASDISTSAQGTQFDQPSEGWPHGQSRQHGMLSEILSYVIVCHVIDIVQLEKYSTNLEAVVAERTAELAAEKAKTDELVCRKFTSLQKLVYKTLIL